jgi:hypothetical protein
MGMNHTPEKYVICKNNKTVRTIRIEKSNSAGTCSTTYTKAGIDRIVGSGRSVSGCIKILENVKGNLEEADWRCRVAPKVSINQIKDAIKKR